MVDNVDVVVLDGLHPPIPSQRDDPSAKTRGQKLLQAVRASENETLEIAPLLNTLAVMTERCSRGGLLQGNYEEAERILSSKHQDSGGISGAQREKKGRKGAGRHQASSLHVSLDADSAEGASALDDNSLLLSGIVRLLGGHQGLSSPKIFKTHLHQQLTAAAADLCVAIGEHVKPLLPKSRVALAEYQLLAKAGRNLLAGLSRSIKGLLLGFDDGATRSRALVSCFRAASSLVSLFGTKLSRNTAVVIGLRAGAWDALALPRSDVQDAAAILLGCIPWTGVGNKSPASIWSESFVNWLTGLSLLLESVAPVSRRKTTLSQLNKLASEETKDMVGSWVDQLRTGDGEKKAKLFGFQVRGLTRAPIALLNRDACPLEDPGSMKNTTFPLNDCLEVVGAMMSFSSSAESLFFSTKKRLRHEAVQNGLLSPHEIAVRSANVVKKNGHCLLQAVLWSIGRPLAIKVGSRIMRLVNTALRTSTSQALKQALDPTVAMRSEGKKRRWLHESILLRTTALQSWQSAINTIGPCVFARAQSQHQRGKRSLDIDKIVALVVGCLLEQFSWENDDQQILEWGSRSERVAYICVASETVDAILKIGKGFLSLPCRTLIDSAIKSCLSSVHHSDPTSLLGQARVKALFLKLGASTLLTPWPDGSMSVLLPDVRRAARRSSLDRNKSVAVEASLCLQVCESFVTPRAPPLTLVMREQSSKPNRAVQIEDAETLIAKVQSASNSLTEKRKQTNEEEEARKQQKRRKRESTTTKRRPSSGEAEVTHEVEDSGPTAKGKETATVMGSTEKQVESKELVSSQEMLRSSVSGVTTDEPENKRSNATSAEDRAAQVDKSLRLGEGQRTGVVRNEDKTSATRTIPKPDSTSEVPQQADKSQAPVNTDDETSNHKEVAIKPVTAGHTSHSQRNKDQDMPSENEASDEDDFVIPNIVDVGPDDDDA